MKGSTPISKTVNPKHEANRRLPHYFMTRADQTTLPKNIIALKQQLPLRARQSNLAAAKQRHPYINRLFAFTELKTVLGRHRKTAAGEDGFTDTFYTKTPCSFKKRILNLFHQSWTEGKLPEQWKIDIVTPIAKPGGKGHHPSPYCPPSL